MGSHQTGHTTFTEDQQVSSRFPVEVIWEGLSSKGLAVGLRGQSPTNGVYMLGVIWEELLVLSMSHLNKIPAASPPPKGEKLHATPLQKVSLTETLY